LPLEAHEKVTSTVAAARIHPIKVWVVPAAHRLALYQASVENFFGIPLLGLRTPAILPHQRLVKRFFDICFSIVFLIFAAPLMGLIALFIRLDSSGPVFFRQKRIGENGRLFEMYKFRTMVENAEALRHTVEKLDEKGNLIHKHRDDPRITRVGRVLRRYSLDELPQFINVLRGEMSVVGPRPELPYLVKKYNSWQYIRFTVPQGVTGWWQVNGRSSNPMHLNTEKDIYYIKNYSFWLDLKIILRTPLVLLRQEGAF
jgi:exopolysaccharide biosynthesis polyprenyl glycosylphosphotransferase